MIIETLYHCSDFEYGNKFEYNVQNMSHGRKILLLVFHERIINKMEISGITNKIEKEISRVTNKIEKEISDQHFLKFLINNKMREAMFCVIILREKYMEVEKRTFMFVL